MCLSRERQLLEAEVFFFKFDLRFKTIVTLASK